MARVTDMAPAPHECHGVERLGARGRLRDPLQHVCVLPAHPRYDTHTHTHTHTECHTSPPLPPPLPNTLKKRNTQEKNVCNNCINKESFTVRFASGRKKV